MVAALVIGVLGVLGAGLDNICMLLRRMSNLDAEDMRREERMMALHTEYNRITNELEELRTRTGHFNSKQQKIMINTYRELKAEKEKVEERLKEEQAAYTRNFSKIQARRVARMAAERQERTRQLAQQRKEAKASRKAPKAKSSRMSSRSKRGGGRRTRKRL